MSARTANTPVLLAGLGCWRYGWGQALKCKLGSECVVSVTEYPRRDLSHLHTVRLKSQPLSRED
jgi:hypothetical protein